MPELQVPITKLEAALARGVLEVESDGERIRFTSTASLIEAINYFRQRESEQSDPSYAGPIRAEATWYDSEW